MKAAQFFLTGTDTDVGKTCIALGLIHAANQAGMATAAFKPVAAGCGRTANGLRNSDALSLQSVVTLQLDYDELNPIALEPAIAPHIAAEQLGRSLSISRLAGFYRGVMLKKPDFVLVEGAGGWRVPVNRIECLSKLAQELSMPVILVVGLRLGCLNHAVLTAEAIVADGLPIAGWVANRLDPDMPAYAENVAYLADKLPAPCLGEVPHLDDITPESVAKYLDISKLCLT